MEKTHLNPIRGLKKAMHSLRTSIAEAPPRLRKVACWVLSLGAVLITVLVVMKSVSRSREEHRLEEEAKAGPHVRVVSVKKTPGDHTVSVMGEALPYATVTLYAKVSGYLRDVTVDKGDVVKKNQILAKIESPETDEQFQGAYSDAKNKKAIANRMRVLLKKQLVSPQEAETAFTDSEIAQSKFGSAGTLKGYELIRAPFDGTVTARFADPGALVQNAANASTGALPIVTVSQIDELRVYLYLDQRDATFVTVGSPVKVTVSERPGFEVEARISRLSGELDPKTRMLLTEVDLDNKKGEFVAGSFVQVTVQVHTPTLLEVPVEALVEQQGKTMLAVVTPDDTIHFQEVKVSNNDGQSVSLLSGVDAGQKVAMNLGTTLQEGAHIRPIADEVKPTPSAAPSPSSSTGSDSGNGAAVK